MLDYKVKDKLLNFSKRFVVFVLILLALVINVSNKEGIERNYASEENISFLDNDYLQNYVKEKLNIEAEVKDGVLTLKNPNILKEFEEITFVEYYNESNKIEKNEYSNFRSSDILMDANNNHYTEAFYKKDNMFLYLAHRNYSEIVGLVSIKILDITDEELSKTNEIKKEMMSEGTNIDFMMLGENSFKYLVAQFNTESFVDDIEHKKETEYLKNIGTSIFYSLYLFMLSILFLPNKKKKYGFKRKSSNLFNYKKKKNNVMKIKQIEMKRKDSKTTEKIEDKKFVIKIKND